MLWCWALLYFKKERKERKYRFIFYIASAIKMAIENTINVLQFEL